jgi:hypothetical protein
LAGLDRPISTRGPPFVPRKTIRVRAFASDCACANGNFIIDPRVPNIEIFRSLRRCSIYFSSPSETRVQPNLVNRLKPSAQQIALFPRPAPPCRADSVGKGPKTGEQPDSNPVRPRAPNFFVKIAIALTRQRWPCYRGQSGKRPPPCSRQFVGSIRAQCPSQCSRTIPHRPKSSYHNTR